MRRARQAEIRALEYFLKQNLYFLYHNKKVSGVEIDLIFLDQKGNIIFIEVKSLSQRGLVEGRLYKKQEERLLKAKLFFESIYSLPVEVRLALVTREPSEVVDFPIL